MYSIVGSHLWISLHFSSSSRGALARLPRYHSCAYFVTKNPTKKPKVGTYNRSHINNVVHLNISIGNVLYCRFLFMD